MTYRIPLNALFVKQKNRHPDGSFVLREKVYEEMQDKSVSLKTNCL
jgi:hypothetical protein